MPALQPQATLLLDRRFAWTISGFRRRKARRDARWLRRLLTGGRGAGRSGLGGLGASLRPVDGLCSSNSACRSSPENAKASQCTRPSQDPAQLAIKEPPRHE